MQLLLDLFLHTLFYMSMLCSRCFYLYVNMCKLYTPEVLALSLLSACLGCIFYFFAEAYSSLQLISCRIEYFGAFVVCVEKEKAAVDLHIGDLIPNHSVYCVWTGHTSVVTGCCSATCTTVQHLVKWRAKLLFSISPLNRSLSLSIHLLSIPPYWDCCSSGISHVLLFLSCLFFLLSFFSLR